VLQDFLPKLKNHLLGRLLGKEFDGDETPFTATERRTITIVNDCIYRHKVLRVNYTSYDLRRGQDSLNPRTHADVMMLSPEVEGENDDPHPYWYARILGIYHARVVHTGPLSHSREPLHMEFLFVRWFGRDMTSKGGWRTKRLHRIGFVPGNDDAAFGFLDPSRVIRGVHLIPAFTWGHTTQLLPPSVIARSVANDSEDWALYYVGM
jgi:hypothetical protein